MTNKMKNNYIVFISFVIVLILVIFIGISFGAVKVSLSDICNIIFKGKVSDDSLIIKDIRLPRVILAGLIGAGLSAVGGVMQGIFRNPLVDSYTLGMSSGAAVGAVISIITGINITIFGISTTGLFAFIGAVSTLFLVYALSYTKNKVSINSLLLAGVVISYFLSAVISFMMMLSHNKIEHIVFWTMGSLTLATWEKCIVAASIILPGIIILIFFSRELNILSMGEESSQHLGINTKHLKNILLITSSVIVGCVVSTGGTIGFLGLISPHIIRMMSGADNKKLIPLSALLGSSLLILADTIGRIIISPVEIPVGIMTSLMGGPFFIFILRRQKKELKC